MEFLIPKHPKGWANLDSKSMVAQVRNATTTVMWTRAAHWEMWAVLVAWVPGKDFCSAFFFGMFPVVFFRCGWITLSPISSQGQTALPSMAGRKWRICSRCWGMSKSMSCWSTSKPTIAGSKGWKPGTVDGWKAMVQDHLAVMIATGYPQDLQKKSQKKEQFGVPSSLGWTAPYSLQALGWGWTAQCMQGMHATRLLD